MGSDTHLGYLGGAEDYWNHTYLGGVDLRDNTQVVWNESGTYSTHLFTQKAIEIVEAHDKDQVGVY